MHMILHILPCRRSTSCIIRPQSIKPQTVAHASPWHISIVQPLDIRKNLPRRRPILRRTSQEPCCSQARETEGSKGRARCERERRKGGAGWDGAGVGLGEAKAAGGSYVDNLAARNFGVLGAF